MCRITAKYCANHIIEDYKKIENSIKGIRIWHYAFAVSIILCSTPT